MNVWVAGADGTEHAVGDEQIAAARTGVYAARCGVRVVAAAMVAPALRRCTECARLLGPKPGRRVGLLRTARYPLDQP